jgi:hypothetical protein
MDFYKISKIAKEYLEQNVSIHIWNIKIKPMGRYIVIIKELEIV